MCVWLIWVVVAVRCHSSTDLIFCILVVKEFFKGRQDDDEKDDVDNEAGDEHVLKPFTNSESIEIRILLTQLKHIVKRVYLWNNH